MPIIKSAIKKMHQDKGRTERNKGVEKTMKDAYKKAKKAASTKTLKAAFQAIDRAAKKKVIHKNKAARLKSNLTRKKPTKK